MNAKLILACRNLKKAHEVFGDLLKNNKNIHLMELDLSN
jgi:hypothetical protein